MQRCLQLAAKGLGYTYPNPVVGCVIVHEKKIIGEGWHQKAGTPHAEVHAVASVTSKELLTKATIYISLEPCNHQGKTPPCVDLILQCGFKKVIVGTLDPNPLVAGKGVDRLRTHGCEVVVGCMEAACKVLNKRFFTFHQKKRPFIVLKWAQSADGFIAPQPNKRTDKSVFWLSDSFSQQLAHQWRSEENAVLIGHRTLLQDNPKLDVRHWTGTPPIPVLIAPSHSLNSSYLLSKNSRLLHIKTDHSNFTESGIVSPSDILSQLYYHSMQSVLIEGGTFTLQQFIDANLWDEIRCIHTSKKLLKGIQAPVVPKNSSKKIPLLNDQLWVFTNKA